MRCVGFSRKMLHYFSKKTVSKERYLKGFAPIELKLKKRKNKFLKKQFLEMGCKRDNM